MDRKPGQPEEQEPQRRERPPGDQPGLPSVAGPLAPGGIERLGPLALRRMRKDDGRALIVYSREPPPQ